MLILNSFIWIFKMFEKMFFAKSLRIFAKTKKTALVFYIQKMRIGKKLKFDFSVFVVF